MLPTNQSKSSSQEDDEPAASYHEKMLEWTILYLQFPDADPPPPHPMLADSRWMTAYKSSPEGLAIAGRGLHHSRPPPPPSEESTESSLLTRNNDGIGSTTNTTCCIRHNHPLPPSSVCIVYVGLSHMPKRIATDENAPAYDLDFEGCGAYQNHGVMLRKSVERMGITTVKHVMATNANHHRHDHFCELLGADPTLAQASVTPQDEADWITLWAAGPGGAGNGLPAGHRLKKIVDANSLPDADSYVFVRCDILLKQPLHEMNLNFDKINFGWIEQRGPSLAMGDHFSEFKNRGRVAGSGLHVVPRRLLDVFVEAYSRDHNSLHWLLKEKKIQLLTDVHFIAGIDRAWSSSSDIMVNPLYQIIRGSDWPSPNIQLRLSGVIAHVADHAARGADLTKPPYSLLVTAIEMAQE